MIAVAAVLGFVCQGGLIQPKFLSCGLIVAIGLFTLVINAATLMLAGSWANSLFNTGLSIDGFWPAFWGSIVISIVSFLLSVFIPEPEDSQQ